MQVEPNLVSSSTSYQRPYSFFEVLIAIICEPRSTLVRLLSTEKPPHALKFHFLFFVSLTAPLISKMIKSDLYSPQDVILGFAIGAIGLITFILFCFFQGTLLVVLGAQFTWRQLFAALSYMLAPITAGLWIVYGLNYFHDGELSIFHVVFQGAVFSDQFLSDLPLFFAVIQFFVLYVFFQVLRALGDFGAIMAFLVSIISLVPSYLSFVISIFLVEMFHPGTVGVLKSLREIFF